MRTTLIIILFVLLVVSTFFNSARKTQDRATIDNLSLQVDSLNTLLDTCGNQFDKVAKMTKVNFDQGLEMGALIYRLKMMQHIQSTGSVVSQENIDTIDQRYKETVESLGYKMFSLEASH